MLAYLSFKMIIRNLHLAWTSLLISLKLELVSKQVVTVKPLPTERQIL